MYGPITTLHHKNRLVKHIPWTAFKLTDTDWYRVVDARDILGVHALFPLFLVRPIDCCIGFQPHPGVLFGRPTTHTLARTPCPGRVAVGLGKEA